MLFIYRLIFPVGLLFFLPGLYWKYRRRPGYKETFGERFGRFTPERVEELKNFHGATWIHAVSVGETIVASGLIKAWSKADPARKFVISTTTTTGQALARQQSLPNVEVIFCPIDLRSYVRRAFDVVRPGLLVIFETEIWPNMIDECRARKIPAALVNARMSDRSARGYTRFRMFFGPLLRLFNVILAQSEADGARFKRVSPQANVMISGNLKFDQPVPENLPDAGYADYFGAGKKSILLAASTHPGEEALLTEVFVKLAKDFPDLRLVLVPRHAERGNEVAAVLEQSGVSFFRKSLGGTPPQPVSVLLADTTGEMLKLMKSADIVVMGKSLAGHDEGHNLIEPALFDKPIVTGAVLRNFRFILGVLQADDAVLTVDEDGELEDVLRGLLLNPADGIALGKKAGNAIRKHAGATRKTIEELEKLS